MNAHLYRGADDLVIWAAIFVLSSGKLHGSAGANTETAASVPAL
ncbi:MAG TPA: hypothetical protein VH084_15000 [Mycobacterium sp.]|nr:hypothetical protein [Mycobacterium sp.]